MMIEVTLRGRKIKLNFEDFKKTKASVHVISDKKTKYVALLNGKRIPVKRALYEVLKAKGYDLTLQDFTTEDAVRILRKFNIPILTLENLGNKDFLLSFAGRLSIGGNALEDEKGLYTA